MRGLPAVSNERREEGRIELDIEVGADNLWFEGHFPEFAILPGVVQIGWAVHYAHALFGLPTEVRTLEQVKFKRPLLPGARVTLRLAFDAKTRKLRYEYRDAQTSYSSGTLDFGAAP